jgi:hypothetical protein
MDARNQTPLDKTAANRLARGCRQQEWLQLLQAPAGLNASEGRYGEQTAARLAALTVHE